MSIPSLDSIAAFFTIAIGLFGAFLAGLWLSLVIWTFRDMRARSRDAFAQVLAAVVVAVLPGVGLVIYLILRPPDTLVEAYERALEEEALLQEIDRHPTCPECSRAVSSEWIACAHCHADLRKGCEHCGQLLELQWELCPFCAKGQARPVKRDSFASEDLSLRRATPSSDVVLDDE